MSEDAAVGKTVTVYDESLDESCKGVIDDYYPGRGYHVQYYNGDDIWLRNLDKNVIFEDDIGNTHKSTLGNTYSSTVDEIEILDKMTNKYLSTNAVKLNDTDNDSSLRILNKLSTNRMDTGCDMVHGDHPYSGTDSSKIDCKMIPDAIGGVLVLGKIISISNLVNATNMNDTDSNGIFYRVFYQEDGFKNNIFNADVAPITSFGDCGTAVWNSNNNTFPFEMVLPSSVRQISSFKGEICLSFYRMRKSGGNDVIGHLQFKLSDLAKRPSTVNNDDIKPKPRRSGRYKSTIEEKEDQVEIRTIDGSYVLCQKNGFSLVPLSDGPEVKLRLDLCWRGNDFEKPVIQTAADVESQAEENNLYETDDTSNYGRNGNSMNSPSSLQRVRPNTTTRTTRSRSRSPSGSVGSIRSAGTVTSRPRSAGGNTVNSALKLSGKKSVSGSVVNKDAKPRASSAGKRPNSTKNGKVNREMQLKIERENKIMMAKLGKLSTGGVGGNIYDKNISDKQKLKLPSKASVSDGKATLRKEQSIAAKRDLASLNDLHNKLKGEVKGLEISIQDSRAQLTKYQVLLKQCGITTQRMTKQGRGVQHVSSTTSTTSSAVGSKNVGALMNKYVEGAGDVMTNKGEDFDVRIGTSNITIDDIIRKKEEDVKEAEASIEDNELREACVEHATLQETRRVLLHRIATAKTFCTENLSKVTNAVNAVELVKKRLNPESDMDTAVATTKRGKSANTLYEEDANVEQEYDTVLRNKISKLTTETLCLRSSLEEGTHNMKLDAEIEEGYTIAELLTQKMKLYSETLESLVYKRDMLQEKLRCFHAECDGVSDDIGGDDGKAVSLRDKILILRSRLLRFHSDKTCGQITKRTTDLEVDMIRTNNIKEC